MPKSKHAQIKRPNYPRDNCIKTVYFFFQFSFSGFSVLKRETVTEAYRPSIDSTQEVLRAVEPVFEPGY